MSRARQAIQSLLGECPLDGSGMGGGPPCEMAARRGWGGNGKSKEGAVESKKSRSGFRSAA